MVLGAEGLRNHDVNGGTKPAVYVKEEIRTRRGCADSCQGLVSNKTSNDQHVAGMEEKVQEAANKAGLDSLLKKKEKGINEMLMENGKNLSGGERQRISIARAIVKDCEILFADEGTSSLDEELGRKVEDTILSLDCTVVAISHRYYEGITEKYDYVLEIKNNQVNQYTSDEYFMEVAI